MSGHSDSRSLSSVGALFKPALDESGYSVACLSCGSTQSGDWITSAFSAKRPF